MSDDHFVTFNVDGWFIEHPPECRASGALARGDCASHQAIMRVYDHIPDGEDYGRWRITEIDSEGLPTLERAPLDDLDHTRHPAAPCVHGTPAGERCDQGPPCTYGMGVSGEVICDQDPITPHEQTDGCLNPVPVDSLPPGARLNIESIRRHQVDIPAISGAIDTGEDAVGRLGRAHRSLQAENERLRTAIRQHKEYYWHRPSFITRGDEALWEVLGDE